MVNVGNNRNVAQIHVAPELSLCVELQRALAWLAGKGNFIATWQL
jgi:hypothetical protein